MDGETILKMSEAILKHENSLTILEQRFVENILLTGGISPELMQTEELRLKTIYDKVIGYGNEK